MFQKIKSFFLTWSEFWSLPLAIMLWAASPYMLRWIDPTAGTYDAGIFQILLFALISMLIFNFATWIGLLLNFKAIFNYFEIDFDNDFKTLSPWQKIKLSLVLYLGLLFGLILLARVI